MNKQNDLFDRVGAIQPGNRQIDLEQIIEEKQKMPRATVYRRYYYALCARQKTEWLKKCIASPSKGMTKLDIATVKLVLRDRGETESV